MPDVLINGYGYGYNKVGMKMYERRAHDSNLGNVFKYDAVHRLTGVKYNSPESSNPDTTQFEKTWEAHYDQVDNILSIIKTQNQQTETITPEIPAGTDNSRLNQYAAFGQFSLTYDANGNTKSKGDRQLYYDYRNQLVRISEGGSTTAEYKYDALGRRIEKNMGSDIFRYFFSGNQVIEERDGTDAITRQFFYGDGIDEILRMDRYINGVPSPYYFHTNDIGSVTAITNGNGNLVERMSYDAFGRATITDYLTDPANPAVVNQSVISNDLLFHARRYDAETGLYYYRARYYDPLMGRFLQTDPMGYRDSMNLYQAFNMNGMNFVDPMGKYKIIAENGNAVVITEAGEEFGDIVKDISIKSNWQEVAKHNKLKISPLHLFHDGEKILIPQSIIPNITIDLNSKMRKHADGSEKNNPFDFRANVQNKGKWDLKNLKGTIYESGKYKHYVFRDRIIRSDAPGNIHYGYVGKAAFWSWDTILYSKAGEAQIAAGTSEKSWQKPPYYGDDPIDHEYIKYGIELYKQDNK